MYVRVKRHKTTWFIETPEHEPVSGLKRRIAELLPGKTTKDLQLNILGKQPGTFTPLEDDSHLDQLGILDDSILYMSLWIPSESNPSDGKWEVIDVPDFASLDTAQDKGKEVVK